MMSLWPILCRTKEILGYRVQEYLKELNKDIKAVSQSGITIGDLHFKVSETFICHTSTGVFLKCTNGHPGQSRGEMTTQKGRYMNGKVFYTEISAELSTDQPFGMQGYQQLPSK